MPWSWTRLIDGRTTSRSPTADGSLRGGGWLRCADPAGAGRSQLGGVGTLDVGVDEGLEPGVARRVEIITSGDAAAEEADVLAQAVEAILDADETLGLLVEGTRLTRTEVDQGGEGDTPVLAARLSFEISYWTTPVIDDGVLPLQVLVSWVPEIGTRHEHSYQPVGTHYRESSP